MKLRKPATMRKSSSTDSSSESEYFTVYEQIEEDEDMNGAADYSHYSVSSAPKDSVINLDDENFSYEEEEEEEADQLTSRPYKSRVKRASSPSHFRISMQEMLNYSGEEAQNSFLFGMALPHRMNTLLTSVAAIAYSQDRPVFPNQLYGKAVDNERHYNSVERLMSAVRRRRILEEWTLLEQAKFHVGICLHGKQFHLIAKTVQTKSTGECVHYYYDCFKKSAHYRSWKSGALSSSVRANNTN